MHTRGAALDAPLGGQRLLLCGVRKDIVDAAGGGSASSAPASTVAASTASTQASGINAAATVVTRTAADTATAQAITLASSPPRFDARSARDTGGLVLASPVRCARASNAESTRLPNVWMPSHCTPWLQRSQGRRRVQYRCVVRCGASSFSLQTAGTNALWPDAYAASWCAPVQNCPLPLPMIGWRCRGGGERRASQECK